MRSRPSSLQSQDNFAICAQLYGGILERRRVVLHCCHDDITIRPSRVAITRDIGLAEASWSTWSPFSNAARLAARLAACLAACLAARYTDPSFRGACCEG